MDFRSLQHMRDSAIHCSRAFQARYGPRSGFGYPLRGFRPPNPGRLCFTPAALAGFALRSVLLRRGNRCVSARPHPLAVCPVGKRPARSRGPARQAAASGICPAPESLANDECLARRTLEAPLGFALTGFARHRLGRVFAQPPLARFAAAGLCRPTPASAPESQSAMTCPQPETAIPRGRLRKPSQGFHAGTFHSIR